MSMAIYSLLRDVIYNKAIFTTAMLNITVYTRLEKHGQTKYCIVWYIEPFRSHCLSTTEHNRSITSGWHKSK